MTTVDFYNLASSDPSSLLEFTARLALKAWRSGHNVYIHCDDMTQVSDIRDSLYTVEPSSLPAVSSCDDKNIAPIHIGFDDEHAPRATSDVMINAASSLALCFSRFVRLLEITNQQEDIRNIKRQNYKFYRERSYQIKSHNI